jgi:hypothetical protein
MWYLSDVISDLAFVFPYVQRMREKYQEYGLLIDYVILIEEDGIRVVITPYEPTYRKSSV